MPVRKVAATLLPLLIVFFLSFGLHAQVITSSVEGFVRDASQAFVPGAKVRLTNTGTNAQVNVTTGEDGRFVAPSLQPGSYVLTVESPGFKRFERSGIVLQVNQTARMDVVLEVGPVTESVKVTADSPLLEASTSSVGQVIENSSIVNLPLNDRNPFNLIFLAPGVHGQVSNRFNGMNWSANGGRPGTNEILLDGVPSSPPVVKQVQGFTVFPSVDAIQEFKMETNNYSAEFGRSGGSIVNLIYKSGTNQFHGSLFEFLRNSKLDANNFFANQSNIPLQSFKRNQFGASIGGPVTIPRIYSGRDRTFFHVTYEGLRERSAGNLSNATVPTEKQLRGDFSDLTNTQQRPVIIYDPLTTTRVGNNYTRQPFAGNVIPPDRIDPVARRVAQYWPSPTSIASTGTGLLNAAGPQPTTTNQVETKLDQIINDSHRIFGRVSRRKLLFGLSNFFPGEDQIAAGGSDQNQDSVGSAVDYTWTAAPTFLVNGRAGFSRMHLQFVPRSDGFDPTQLGFPEYLRANADRMVFPGFDAAGYLGLGNGAVDFRRSSFETFTTMWSATKIAASHQVKFGFEARILRVHVTEVNRASGAFSFGREFTQGPNPVAASNTAGDGFASFLLGLGSGSLVNGHKNISAQSLYYGWYLADDWKVTRRLTLNLGLRYELDLPRTERFDRMTRFDPEVLSPLGPLAGLPNLRGGLVFVGVDGHPRTQFSTDKNNWAPRLGFAYQAASRLVVRGAFGMFYAPAMSAAGGDVANYGYRSDTPYVGSADNGLTVNHYLRDPFPNGFNRAAGSSLGLLTAVGDSIAVPIGESPVPYTLNWNFGLQYELPGGILVEPSYVAARGLKLTESHDADYNLNQLRPEQLEAGNSLLAQVPNPFAGLIAIGALSRPTVQALTLLRAYPQYPTVFHMYRTGSSSIYHSFQLKAQRRFSKGVSFLASYTAGKQMDDHSTIAIVGADSARQNIYDRASDWAVSPQDVAQRLVISSVVELPFGRGHRLGGSWPGAVDALLGGWQFNGITTFSSGQPLTIITANTSNSGSQVLRPNNNGRSAKVEGPIVERLDRYFDTSVFSVPAPFTFGNVGRTLPDVRAPGIRNFDLSVFKNFKIAERKTLQFRVEAFNAMNTPRFGVPVLGANNAANFGRIRNQGNTPRQIQFGLKFLF